MVGRIITGILKMTIPILIIGGLIYYFGWSKISNTIQDKFGEYSNKVFDVFESDGKIRRKPLKIKREPTIKKQAGVEVEAYNLNTEKISLKISKKGLISSEKTTNIVSETPAYIDQINIRVGDYVEEGQTLITLGKSTGTKIADVQAQGAHKNQNLLAENKLTMDLLGQQNINLAQIAAKNAILNYNQALEIGSLNKKNIKQQITDTGEILDDLEDEYQKAKKSLKKAKKTVGTRAGATDQEITALSEQVKVLNSQKKQAEKALETAKDNYKVQAKQIDYNTELALNQSKSVLSQIDSVTTNNLLQQLQIEGQIIQAETTLLINEINQNQKYITAKADGKITEILVDEKNYINPGQPLMVLETTDTLIATTSLNEKEIGYLENNDIVEIKVGDQTSFGEITRIAPKVDAISKKYEIEISIEEAVFEINEIGEIEFEFEPDDIFIPLNSIFLENNKKFVWLIHNDEVEKQQVKTGILMNGFIKINSGLDGDEIIVKNSDIFLNEGDKILIAQNE